MPETTTQTYTLKQRIALAIVPRLASLAICCLGVTLRYQDVCEPGARPGDELRLLLSTPSGTAVCLPEPGASADMASPFSSAAASTANSSPARSSASASSPSAAPAPAMALPAYAICSAPTSPATTAPSPPTVPEALTWSPNPASSSSPNSSTRP